MADVALAVAIRVLHVLAVAVLLGGAALLAALARGRAPAPVLLAAAVPFEAMAWAAVGVLVMTGVGNAGALGADLPRTGSPWGDRFLLKLGAVVLLLVLSMTRTLVVALAAAAPEPPPRTLGVLRGAYAATGLLVAGIGAMGVLLAHG